MASKTRPKRGEIWDVDLDPVTGHEQGGRRPALILSIDEFNDGPADLVTAIPVTSRDKKIRSHVRIEPPEGGCTEVSFIKAEEVRTISIRRLGGRRGSVSDITMAKVETIVRFLLKL